MARRRRTTDPAATRRKPKPRDRSAIAFLHGLLRTAAYVRRTATRGLARTNLTPEEWLVLETISAEPGLNQGRLAAHTMRDRPTLSRLVDALEHRRLVTRTYDPDDRRAIFLSLSARGIDVLTRARLDLTAGDGVDLHELSDDQLDEGAATFDAIREGFWDN